MSYCSVCRRRRHRRRFLCHARSTITLNKFILIWAMHVSISQTVPKALLHQCGVVTAATPPPAAAQVYLPTKWVLSTIRDVGICVLMNDTN